MSTTQDYGEPWHLDFGTSAVLDRRDCLALVVPAPRRRAISCVNACVGMADPAAEIAAMRKAIKEAYDAVILGENPLPKLRPFLKP